MFIGVKPGKNDDPQNRNTISPDKKLEKYWKKVFKPLKNEEIEITISQYLIMYVQLII